MIVFERRFDMIVYIIRHKHVSAKELRLKFEVSDSTVRADMNALSQYYPVTSIQGHGGGYSLVMDTPVFCKHVDMLYHISETIVRIGGIDGYDAILMQEAIRALLQIELHGSRNYL